MTPPLYIDPLSTRYCGLAREFDFEWPLADNSASWCYGYHLSELNFPAVSITCLPQGIPPPSRLPLCLGINQHRYGLITAIYTVGGLVGSLASSKVVEKQGIKGGLLLSSYINLLGVIIMTSATHWNRVAARR